MRLRIAYLLAWTLATTVVAGASWLGIHSLLAPVPLDVGGSVAAPRAEASAATQAAPATPGQATAPGVPAPGPQWTPVPSQRGGTAYRRLLRTEGGDALVWCEPGSARIITSTPKPGFSVNVSRESDDTVQVSFTRQRQAYRILIRWWDGPYAEVAESVT